MKNKKLQKIILVIFVVMPFLLALLFCKPKDINSCDSIPESLKVEIYLCKQNEKILDNQRVLHNQLLENSINFSNETHQSLFKQKAKYETF